jgi:hypothetical protein
MSARRVKRDYGPVGSLAQQMRPECSECLAPVEWLGLGDAVDVLGVDLVNEFLGRLNWDGEVELDFWRCVKCGNAGALSAPVFE